MKKTVLIVGLLLALPLISCRNTKEAEVPVLETTVEAPVEIDHGSEPAEDSKVMGIVKVEGECTVIEVTYGDVIYRYAPINLDQKYLKDGLRIKFAFKEETNFQGVLKCEAINQVISVSEVTPYR